MEIETVSLKSVLLSSHIIKPNYHLNYGKKRLEKAIKNKNRFKPLGEVVEDIYTGGIFKRVFVGKEEYGLPYISAQHMMDINPLKISKTISKKHTPRQEDMTLRSSQILVSCAGTVGNVRLIGEDLDGIIGSQDIIRIISSGKSMPYGYIYAYLASPTAYSYIQSFIYGSVVPRIDPKTLARLPVPILSEDKIRLTHELITTSSKLRIEANKLLKEAQIRLKICVGLKNLTIDDYEYFGTYSTNRPVSVFKRNVREISPTSINAFNYSTRIEKLEGEVKKEKYLKLSDCLDSNQFFSTGSFKRLELDSVSSIRLMNQSDIFNARKVGKLLARKFVKLNKLVEYGEVIIAGVGTLGEGETFCRAIFANEELEGQLISGEFIRMKCKNDIPSGYLFSWLSSDYGFRFIRKTQSGTKLCRPIQELLKELPVPIIEESIMDLIDKDVKRAHTMLYEALNKETKAIELIENEIESWQK